MLLFGKKIEGNLSYKGVFFPLNLWDWTVCISYDKTSCQFGEWGQLGNLLYSQSRASMTFN